MSYTTDRKERQVLMHKKRKHENDGDSTPVTKKPKRALSAYNLFVMDHRNTIKEQYPELQFGEISKKMSEVWKALEQDKKSAYEQQAAQNKRDHEAEMEVWHQSENRDVDAENGENHHDHDDQPAKKRKKKRDPNMPKKNLNAWMMYVTTFRPQVTAAMKAENPQISMMDITKRLGQQWSLLSSEEKSVYEAQAQEDKQRYLTAMEQYRQQSDVYGNMTP